MNYWRFQLPMRALAFVNKHGGKRVIFVLSYSYVIHATWYLVDLVIILLHFGTDYFNYCVLMCLGTVCLETFHCVYLHGCGNGYFFTSKMRDKIVVTLSCVLYYLQLTFDKRCIVEGEESLNEKLKKMPLLFTVNRIILVF
jgi:hypothetical protein